MESVHAIKGDAGEVEVLEEQEAGDDGFESPTVLNVLLSDGGVPAATGLRVWHGGLVAARMLLNEGSHLVCKNRTIIELGAGCGCAGLAAAAAGADVLLTDVQSVVDSSLHHNITRNAIHCSDASSSAFNAFASARIGRGHAAAAPLDWYSVTSSSALPVSQRLGPIAAAAERADLLLASEPCWLHELVEPFVRTSEVLLRIMQSSDHNHTDEPTLLLWAKDRANEHSRSFASVHHTMSLLADHGLHVEELPCNREQTRFFRATKPKPSSQHDE